MREVALAMARSRPEYTVVASRAASNTIHWAYPDLYTINMAKWNILFIYLNKCQITISFFDLHA